METKSSEIDESRARESEGCSEASENDEEIGGYI